MHFKWRRTLSYTITGIAPMLLFAYMAVSTKDLIQAGVVGLVSALLMVFFGKLISGHAWVDWLEGKKVMVLGISSSGFLTPLSANVSLPYLYFNKRGKTIFTLFDRMINFYIKKPINATEKEAEEVTILSIPKKDQARYQFDFEGSPCYIYSDALGCFVTKEFISRQENSILTSHLNLVMLDQVRQARKDISQLTKHAVDQFQPNKFLEILGNPLFQGIVIIVIVIFVILIVAPQLPHLLGYVQEAQSAAGQASGQVIQKAKTAAFITKGVWF